MIVSGNTENQVTQYKIRQKAHCVVYGCKEYATVAVGKRKHDVASTFLCEEHARNYYESLREIFNKNMVGDDNPYRQTEVLKEVLVYILKNVEDKLNLQTIYFIADNLNVMYDESDTKKKIIENCLIFLKGGINNG